MKEGREGKRRGKSKGRRKARKKGGDLGKFIVTISSRITPSASPVAWVE